MNKVTLLLSIIIAYVYSHKEYKRVAHECMHDQMDVSKIVPHDYLETFEERYSERNLQGATPQPMRITVDYKELDNPNNGAGLTPSKKQYLKNIMEAAQIYLNKLIKVIPRDKPIKMLWGDTCYDMKVTKEIQDVGQPNSDLHIYVTYSNQQNTTYLANAIWCQLDPNPVVGRVKFNIGTMNIDGTSTQSFQDNFSTSLHEILHILGFSGNGVNYWIDPDTQKPYGTANSYKVMKQEQRWDAKNVNKVFSKNILRVSRNFYGCSSIDGMYLENQGGGGSMGSHWERDLLGNEFMTASIVYQTYSISEFTAALLLDTGYYAEINNNMLMPFFWGKGKGCDFFNRSCNTGQYFPEFPDPSTKESCDFFSLGIGSSGNYDTFSQCAKVNPYSNAYCDDDVHFKPDEQLRQNTGPGSRCFRSNASIKGNNDEPFKGRCFKAKCAADGQSIDVTIWGDEKVNCKYPDQVINLDKETKTTQGVMRCPPDFDLFCNFPRSCKNNCSNNGVCNNGICYCLSGWTGEDCSKQCPPNSAWDGSRCIPRCPSGQFKTLDNVCRSTCPLKQYKDQNLGTCELCHTRCSTCSGPASNQCTACNNGFALQGNTCIDTSCHESCLTCSGSGSNQCTSCLAGKYLDSNKICQPCKSPCTNCLNANQCSTCIDGYIMDHYTGQCVNKNSCHNSCLTCSGWRDETQCTSCKDGYVLQDNQCFKCEKQCKKCINYQNECTECSTGYIYNANDKRCSMDCDSSCSTCSENKNSRACTSCSTGKYLKNGQCLPCDSSCPDCRDSATFCIKCKNGYKHDEVKGTCTSLCRQAEFFDRDNTCKSCLSPCSSCQFYPQYCTACISGYTLDTARHSCVPSSQACHSSCNSCSKYNDERSCTSCNNGLFLQNGQCVICPKECVTCNSANNCTSCQNGLDLQNGKCIEKNNKCHQSCKTCSAQPNGNKTFCTSCSDNLYLQGDSCLPCQASCKTCSGSSSSCTSCDENQYSYNSKNKSCDPKACHSSCKTCTKPNDSSSCSSCSDGYILQGSACQPCSQTCKTCSNNANTCTSCANGLELKNGTCQQKSSGKCDPSCATCFKDSDPLGCLTCPSGFWIQSNADRSLARCLPCDSSCKQCKSTYECISCSGELVLDQSNYCVPCTNGKNFSNGKCIDAQNVRKSVNSSCDITCSECVGTYYDQCTKCAGNRILSKRTSNLQYGFCVCPPGTSDVNQPMCQVASNLQSNIQSTTTTTFAASAATSTIVSASTANPVAALGMMEFSQSVSYLSYVNKKQPVGFDDTMNVVSYSHTSNLFNLDSYAEQDAQNEKEIKKSRLLQQGSQVEIEIEEEDEQEIRNPKFSQNHKTQLFLINAIVLIVINAAVWAISGILSLISSNQDKNSLFYKLRRIYSISIPIAVFTLSSQEFSLLMFLQMLNLKTVTGLQILSSVFSFLTLFYIIGFTAFLFYCLEHKRVLSESYHDNTAWQERFYLIYKFIKQDSFFTRNFVQITVLRKVIISFITACVVSSPIAQISLLLLCYTSYLIYLTVCRPFKSNLYTVMMIILDSIIVLIHVLYCVMFAYDGDSEKEKVISLMMLFLTFSVFFAYLVYTLVIIGQICYNLFKKWQARKQNQKTFVKRPQSSEENPGMIEQQIGNLSQNVAGPSSNAIQSINHLDEKGMIFSGEVLVKN